MSNLLLKTLSPQSAKAYGWLLKYPKLSAKELGKKMNIIPNTVYRNINELASLGLAERTNEYPAKYQAKPATEALAFYNSVMRQNFYETFGLSGAIDENLKITFFQTRKDLLKFFEKDARDAQQKINIIASGHEVPAETVLAHKLAVDRGIKVRKLIQHLNAENIRVAKIWQKLGVEIRYTPLMNARIVVIDEQIAHFGSYDPLKQPESVGVRFDYAPYAKLMDELFEQKWQQAKII